MRRTFLKTLLLGSLASLSFSGMAMADMLATIQERGTLRVVVPQDSPPFGVPGPNMEIIGYDVDMAQMLAETLGVKLEVVPTNSAGRVPALQSDRADLIISSLGKTPERAEIIDFSATYAPYFVGIYTANGVEIKSADDLEGKTIAVTRGAVDDLELSKIAPASATIQRYEDTNGQLSAFLSGQVDIVVTSNVAAATLAKNNPDRAPLLQMTLKDSPCYIGLPKGEEALLGQIDDLIASAKADGRLNALSQKWFETDLPVGF